MVNGGLYDCFLVDRVCNPVIGFVVFVFAFVFGCCFIGAGDDVVDSLLFVGERCFFDGVCGFHVRIISNFLELFSGDVPTVSERVAAYCSWVQNPTHEVCIAKSAEDIEVSDGRVLLTVGEVGLGLYLCEVVSFVDFATASGAGVVRFPVCWHVREWDVVRCCVPDLGGSDPVVFDELVNVVVDGTDRYVELFG